MLTRDDFEEWLEDHGDEALAHVEGDRLPLKRWITLYGKALHHMVDEGPDEDDEDGEVDFDLFDD